MSDAGVAQGWRAACTHPLQVGFPRAAVLPLPDANLPHSPPSTSGFIAVIMAQSLCMTRQSMRVRGTHHVQATSKGEALWQAWDGGFWARWGCRSREP